MRHAASITAICITILLAFGSTDTSSSNSSSGSSESPSNSSTPKEFKIGDTVPIGYTSYCVWRTQWRESLGNQFMQHKPNAAFLVLNMTIRNDDKKARTIPPLKLIDEHGAEYDAATAGMMQGDEWFSVLEDLNPGVSKEGNIAFDVPRQHTYKLKVSGGFWSTEEALIDLSQR